jgi:acyl carrier protein
MNSVRREGTNMANPKGETERIDELKLRRMIRDYCFTRIKAQGNPNDLNDDTDMFAAGVIDSLDALHLLAGFEEDYGITVPEALDDVSVLATINGICRFIMQNVDMDLLESKLKERETSN